LKTWISILALLITFVSLAEEATPNEPIYCYSIGECKAMIIERGLAREAEKYSMIKADMLLGKHVRLMGEIAIPMLMDLIQHQSHSVRRLAGYTLTEFESIDEKHLPVIIKALDNNTRWLISALGRINSSAAAEEALKRYLASKYQQGFTALKYSGNLAIPYIMEALKCETACPKGYIYNFGRIVVGTKADKGLLLSSFEKLITNKTLSDDVIAGAIEIIAFLEGDALPLEPIFSALLTERPNLESSINNAFISMGTSSGIAMLIESIENNSAEGSIIEIAKKGVKAHAAASVLLNVIAKGNSGERQIAARALGYIGNTIAVPTLIELLTRRFDVELNITATQSLAMLGDESALISLEKVKSTHWYPPVRKAAEEAILVIEGKEELEGYDDFSRFQFYSMQEKFMTEEVCEEITLNHQAESPEVKLYTKTNADDLEKLSFDTHVLSYGASDEMDQILDGKEIIEVNSSNIRENRTPLKQVPELALKVENGWLVGSDRGEWGGELVFIDDEGNSKILLNKSVEDIHRLGNLTIATTGLAHLGMNNGVIYKLELNKNGDWEVSHWIKLPGVTLSSWFVETGELLLNTLHGGSILLSESAL